MTAQPPAWFLRSVQDRDTHTGVYSGASRSVHALCGIEFVPRPLAYGRIALPGAPLDPDQVCPRCQHSGSRP